MSGKYFAIAVDRRLKRGYRGEVCRFNFGKRETVAVVYGQTLAEMRRRKWAVVRAMNNSMSGHHGPDKETT